MARRLSGHTEKCIISFIDMYRHLHDKKGGIPFRPPDESEMRTLAEKIVAIAKANNIKVETCAEEIDLACLGIEHGKCIDDRLIEELTGVNLRFAKDKNQRELCGCVASVDIGEYNTCRHLCRYCYANSSRKTMEKNLTGHNDKMPLLIGELSEKQKVIERKTASIPDEQANLFKALKSSTSDV